MAYNLRPTSYTGKNLDNELLRRGAATFGSQARKQTRLRRFMTSEEQMQDAYETLFITVQTRIVTVTRRR